MGFNKSEKENRTDFLFYLIFSVPCPDKQISTALTACTCDTQYQFNAASLTQRLGVFFFYGLRNCIMKCLQHLKEA